MDRPVLLLRVAEAEAISRRLRRLTLVDAHGARLPPAAPGAHITLSLPVPGHARPLKNSYTVVSADPERGYTLIVRRTDHSPLVFPTALSPPPATAGAG